MISVLKILLFLVVFLALSENAEAQKGFVVGQGKSLANAKDLTKDVEARSVNLQREQVGPQITLDIRYDQHSTDLVKKIGGRLKESVSRRWKFCNFPVRRPLGYMWPK